MTGLQVSEDRFPASQSGTRCKAVKKSALPRQGMRFQYFVQYMTENPIDEQGFRVHGSSSVQGYCLRFGAGLAGSPD